MSLVTVQRSPDSASDGSSESALKNRHIKTTTTTSSSLMANNHHKVGLNHIKASLSSVAAANSSFKSLSGKSDIKTNRISSELTVKINKLTTVQQSTVQATSNQRKKLPLNGVNRGSFNLDDRPKSSFNDLKAIYSNKQPQQQQQPQGNKLQSNTIPLNRSQTNHHNNHHHHHQSSLNNHPRLVHPNSNLFLNRLSLNLIESPSEPAKFQNEPSKLKKFGNKFKSLSDRTTQQDPLDEDNYSKNIKASFTIGPNEIKKLNKLSKIANLKQQQSILAANDEAKVAPSTNSRQLIEKYFVVKDAALILPRRSSQTIVKSIIQGNDLTNNNNNNNNYSSLLIKMNRDSSCLTNVNDYDDNDDDDNDDEFANGRYVTSTLKSCRSCELSLDKMDESAITSTSAQEAASTTGNSNSNSNSTGDILLHLQSMISLLRPQDTITLAVKLCSYVQERMRYLVIVETRSNSKLAQCEESALLGLELVQTTASSTVHSQSSQTTLGTTVSESHAAEGQVNEKTPVLVQFSCSVGMVLPIYANCEISLDGDGGFKFKSHHTTHIFKPVSIQAMWSAYQYLHKAFENARRYNFYSIGPDSTVSSPLQAVGSAASFMLNETNELMSANGTNGNVSTLSTDSTTNNHEWAKYYASLIGRNKCEQTYINEWYQKEERSAQREDFTTPYFDCLQLCKEQEEIGLKIKEKLKEIMINSKDDYGSMSSVSIREMLEKELGQKLDTFKKFIDATIFQFYNQLVECATKVLPYLYLGTEWNASNYDSLLNDRVTHILNVSSEVDNFFPDTFKYLNIRVLDIEDTDLLKEFDRTNKFIQEAKEQGTSCFVHCKMGVSRSASVVIAHLMKESDLNYERAFTFVKQKRSCINPNDSFKSQLRTYESILNAHKAKYSLFEPSPQSSSTSLLGFSQQHASEANVTATSLSVKEAINKIKSMSSLCDQPAQTSPTSQTFASPKRHSSANQIEQSLTCVSVPNCCTSSSSDSNNLLSVSPNRSLKLSPVLLDIDLNQHEANHAKPQSDPCSDSETTFDVPQIVTFNPATYDEQQNGTVPQPDLAQVLPQQQQQQQLDKFVPLGTVKRQVESINFNSKPIIINSNNDEFKPDVETIESACNKIDSIESAAFYLNDNNSSSLTELCYNSKQFESDSHTQQSTTSPDSKRFKCEFLQTCKQQPRDSKSTSDACVDEDTTPNDQSSALNRLSEFNRSKKVFEQLEDKLKKQKERVEDDSKKAK